MGRSFCYPEERLVLPSPPPPVESPDVINKTERRRRRRRMRGLKLRMDGLTRRLLSSCPAEDYNLFNLSS